MIAEIIFWVCVAMIVLPYVGYPLLIGLLAALKRPRPIPETTDWPMISVLICARNAEEVICEKIRNVLASDYPGEKLEVIVCSDGSGDDTNKLAGEYPDPRVHLAASPTNIGKNATMALGAAQARGELLLQVDYNELLAPEAIRSAASHFADPKVGIVTGRIIHEDPLKTSVASGYRAYWLIEDGVRLLESRLGLGVVVLGAFEMIRRQAYLPIPSEFSNDMGAPMYANSLGYLCRYEPRAVQTAEQRKTPPQEVRRRVRMVVRAWSSIPYMLGIIPFFKNLGGWLALLTHKYLRWLTWVFMIGLLAANALLLDRLFYQVTFWVQAAAYAMALLGWLLARLGIRVRVLSMPFFFCLLQVGAAIGLVKALRGERIGTWKVED